METIIKHVIRKFPSSLDYKNNVRLNVLCAFSYLGVVFVFHRASMRFYTK